MAQISLRQKVSTKRTRAIPLANVATKAQHVNLLVDKDAFNRIVRKYDADKGCKKYTTCCQLVWMLLFQWLRRRMLITWLRYGNEGGIVEDML